VRCLKCVPFIARLLFKGGRGGSPSPARPRRRFNTLISARPSAPPASTYTAHTANPSRSSFFVLQESQQITTTSLGAGAHRKSFTTFRHFGIFARDVFGESPAACRGRAPPPRIRAARADPACAAATDDVRVEPSTRAPRVAAGTTTPCQVIASNPGTPGSDKVGSSGTVGERCAVARRARAAVHALMYGITEADVAKHQLRLARDDIGERGRGALVRDRAPSCTPVIALKLAARMRGCAASRGSVVQLARLRLREGDQLLDRARRNVSDSRRGVRPGSRPARPGRNLDRVVPACRKGSGCRENAVVARSQV